MTSPMDPIGLDGPCLKKNTVFCVYFFSGNDLGCALTQTLQVVSDQIFF